MYGPLKILKIACSKKVTLSKKRHFFVLFLFLLQDNYSSLVLKIQVSKLKKCSRGHKIINAATKVLFLKRL